MNPSLFPQAQQYTSSYAGVDPSQISLSRQQTPSTSTRKANLSSSTSPQHTPSTNRTTSQSQSKSDPNALDNPDLTQAQPDSSTEEPSNTQKKRGPRKSIGMKWTEDEDEQLYKCVSLYKGGKGVKGPTMWQYIVAELEQDGIDKDANACQRRFKIVEKRMNEKKESLIMQECGATEDEDEDEEDESLEDTVPDSDTEEDAIPQPPPKPKSPVRAKEVQHIRPIVSRPAMTGPSSISSSFAAQKKPTSTSSIQKESSAKRPRPAPEISAPATSSSPRVKLSESGKRRALEPSTSNSEMGAAMGANGSPRQARFSVEVLSPSPKRRKVDKGKGKEVERQGTPTPPSPSPAPVSADTSMEERNAATSTSTSTTSSARQRARSVATTEEEDETSEEAIIVDETLNSFELGSGSRSAGTSRLGRQDSSRKERAPVGRRDSGVRRRPVGASRSMQPDRMHTGSTPPEQDVKPPAGNPELDRLINQEVELLEQRVNLQTEAKRWTEGTEGYQDIQRRRIGVLHQLSQVMAERAKLEEEVQSQNRPARAASQ